MTLPLPRFVYTKPFGIRRDGLLLAHHQVLPEPWLLYS